MKRLFLLFVMLMAADNASAALYCNGTIEMVYKWHNMATLSIRVQMPNGTQTNWINMPTKSDEAMALMAMAAKKPIELYWSPENVTSCIDGWDHNRPLEGFLVVKN